MIPLSLTSILSILNAKLVLDEFVTDSIIIESVSIDSRQSNDHGLFIALSGERFDGHDFAAQAIEQGAIALLVEKPLPLKIPQILVKNTRLALGQLAAHVRSLVSAKVVALTGSSGKTSVKEMAASILSEAGTVLATQGNLNNDIGVPLTLLRLTGKEQFVVIELGANHENEIAYTVDFVRPDAALINNVAAAHLAGFGSLEGVAKAKGEIIQGVKSHGKVIINKESNNLSLWTPLLKERACWTFSACSDEADFYAKGIKFAADNLSFVLHTPLGNISIQLPLPGRHNIANALAASALAISVGASLEQVKMGLSKLRPVKGRLYPISLNLTQKVIDDTYNANVGSMRAAIDFLSELTGYRVLVVGDMAELGPDSIDYHRQLGQLAKEKGIDEVLGVGVLSEHLTHAHSRGKQFSSKTLLANYLKDLIQQQKHITILLKGSRSAAMEEIIPMILETKEC